MEDVRVDTPLGPTGPAEARGQRVLVEDDHGGVVEPLWETRP